MLTTASNNILEWAVGNTWQMLRETTPQALECDMQVESYHTYQASMHLINQAFFFHFIHANLENYTLFHIMFSNITGTLY